jgi:hypothetical protein
MATNLTATLYERQYNAAQEISIAPAWFRHVSPPAPVQTAGPLVVGQRYSILLFVSGDSFTNVGAASNTTGVIFVATGTTPTTWTHSSQISLLPPDSSLFNSYELAQLQTYLDHPTDDMLARLRSPDVITAVNAYEIYYAFPAYLAWSDADTAARQAQWKLFCADALINNKATTSASADTGGSGSTPPPDYQPPGTNVP